MFKIRKEYINTLNEGYTLEINIIDYCNLNCAGCDHFAPAGMGKYIEPEDLLSQLNTIVKQLPNIKKVILLGGEPLLHPKLYEMCTKIRNCFPSIQINIITNGILLNKWNIEDYIKYQNINVGFGITKYPDIDYSTIPPLNNIGYLSTRFLFQDTKIDIYGEQKKEHFYNCSRDNSIGLTLDNGKLYFCPFSACLKNFTNKFNIIIEEVEGIDYLDINNLNIDRILQFCQTPKNICKYCKERQQAFFWHKIENNNIFLEYTQNKQSLYLTNYKDYYRKYNDISLYRKLKDNGMWENVDPIYCANILDRILHRIERTKIDIIIPYYKVNNNLIKTLHKTLSEQNFIDNCTIYFVSDESPQERQVYEEFENSFLNCVFLKTEKRSGPGIARNLAIEESFGEYKFFLDFDDSFGDENTLKFLYDKVLENNYPDIITAKMNDEYWENGQQNRPVLIKSSFLKTKNIRYGELFLNEDAFFSANLFINTDNIVRTDYPAYTYNRRNLLHIPSIFKYGQKEIVIAEIVFDVYLYLHLQDSELLFNGIKFFRHINKLDLSSLSSQIEKNEVFQFYKVCYNKIKKIDKYNLFNENYTLLKEDYNQFNNILEKNIIPEKFKKQLLNL